MTMIPQKHAWRVSRLRRDSEGISMIGRARLIPLLTVTALGCATPGVRPHDESAAEHEREAEEHARREKLHEALAPCPGGAPEIRTDVCWSSVTDATQDHRQAAAEHRQQAAEHRAASAALRQAEAAACAGIAPDDRDISPFEHVEDIVDVQPLREPTTVKGMMRTAGAVVTFRAVPGMTAEWLQRLVDCHLARNSALGHSVPEMPDCPLVPREVQARVTSTGTGFAVAIRSDVDDSAREVLARAERLQARIAAPE
jgi:hypothetical protein